MSLNPEVNGLVNDLADIVGPLVASIEDKPETTRNHYGDYMAAIQRVQALLRKPDSKAVLLAVAVAFIRAGANRLGVRDALKVMGAI